MKTSDEHFQLDWYEGDLASMEAKPEEIGYEIVVFRIADEFYSIDLRYIEEIRTVPAITRIPHGRDFFMGIASLRGNLFPVINIARAFHLPVKEETEDSRLIIFRLPDEMLAFFVDHVEGVERYRKEALIHSHDAMKLSSELYRGIFPYKQGFLAYIDLDQMLASPQFSELYRKRNDR